MSKPDYAWALECWREARTKYLVGRPTPSTAEPSVEQRAVEYLARSFEESGLPDHAAAVRRGHVPGHGTPLWMDESLRAITKALQSTAELADVEQKPLRLCGYCQSWNSKPCGEQCCWSINDPTQEQLEAKALQSTAEAATLIEKLGEALTKAEPFLESDYEAAKEACDADWEGMSFEALSSVREALSLISGEGVRS